MANHIENKLIDYNHQIINNDFWKSHSIRSINFSKFTNLEELDIIDLNISELPSRLPSTLKIIKCASNMLTNIDSLVELINLEILDCSNNPITSVNSLPPNLKILICNGCGISNFDNLPSGLQKLSCVNQSNDVNDMDYILESLNNLPLGLEELYCSNNYKLKTIDNLPLQLKVLRCNNCGIRTLNNLPDSIIQLYCHDNEINKFDKLPSNLKILCCVNNPLEYNFQPTIRNIKQFLSSSSIS